MKFFQSTTVLISLCASAAGFTPLGLRASQTRTIGTPTSLNAEEYDYDFVVIGAGRSTEEAITPFCLSV